MSKTLSHKQNIHIHNKIYTKVLTITKHHFRPFFFEKMCITFPQRKKTHHKRFRVVKLGLVQSKIIGVINF